VIARIVWCLDIVLCTVHVIRFIGLHGQHDGPFIGIASHPLYVFGPQFRPTSDSVDFAFQGRLGEIRKLGPLEAIVVSIDVIKEIQKSHVRISTSLLNVPPIVCQEACDIRIPGRPIDEPRKCKDHSPVSCPFASRREGAGDMEWNGMSDEVQRCLDFCPRVICVIRPKICRVHKVCADDTYPFLLQYIKQEYFG
jgi:hypothetical protein